jgi:hypothetical protein
VAERQALAQRRLDGQAKPAGAPAAPQPAGTVSFDVEAQMLANRQQALDDARMLGNLRDAALDMMRQQYLLSCNSGLAQAGGN